MMGKPSLLVIRFARLSSGAMPLHGRKPRLSQHILSRQPPANLRYGRPQKPGKNDQRSLPRNACAAASGALARRAIDENSPRRKGVFIAFPAARP